MRTRLLILVWLAASACSTRVARAPQPAAAPPPARQAARTTAVAEAVNRQVRAAREVRNAVELGDGDLELRLLRDRLVSHPDDVEARWKLAGRYDALGSPELALDHYRMAAERLPGDAAAQLKLARALDAAGRTADAAALLDAFLAAYAEAPAGVHSWCGILRDKLGHVKAGERHHRAALELEPAHAYLHNNLGQNLLLQGRNGDAAAEFRAALDLEPRSEIARNNLATAVAADPGEAIHHLRSVSDPSTAYSNLAAVLIEQGRYEEARKQLNLALGYRPDNPAALRNLTVVAALDGRPAQWTLAPSAGGESESAWHRVRQAVGRIFVQQQEQAPESRRPEKTNRKAAGAGKARGSS